MNTEIRYPVLDLTSSYFSLRSRFQNGLAPIVISKQASWSELYDEACSAVKSASKAIDDVTASLSSAYGLDFSTEIDKIKELSRSASTLLSRARNAVSQLDRNQSYSAGDLQEGLLQRNAVKSLRHQLASLAFNLHSRQSDYMKAVKRQNDVDLSGDFAASLTESQRKELDAIIVNNTSTAEERLREINELADSVSQLADLTRELAHLVESNGTIVDSIESNITAALDETEKGVQALIKADKNSRRAARSMKIIYVLMVIVFILLIVMVAKIGKKFK